MNLEECSQKFVVERVRMLKKEKEREWEEKEMEVNKHGNRR